MVCIWTHTNTNNTNENSALVCQLVYILYYQHSLIHTQHSHTHNIHIHTHTHTHTYAHIQQHTLPHTYTITCKMQTNKQKTIKDLNRSRTACTTCWWRGTEALCVEFHNATGNIQRHKSVSARTIISGTLLLPLTFAFAPMNSVTNLFWLDTRRMYDVLLLLLVLVCVVCAANARACTEGLLLLLFALCAGVFITNLNTDDNIPVIRCTMSCLGVVWSWLGVIFNFFGGDGCMTGGVFNGRLVFGIRWCVILNKVASILCNTYGCVMCCKPACSHTCICARNKLCNTESVCVVVCAKNALILLLLS